MLFIRSPFLNLFQESPNMSSQMYASPPKNRQRGYGLVEVMISLVIIAILVAIAVALSINLRTSSSITSNTNQITQIAANAKKSFGVSNQYSALTSTRAVRTVVPRELRTFDPATQQYGDTAFNNFGGPILAGFSYLTTNADTMTFVWQNVPKDQCEQLVTQVAGLMRRIEVQAGTAGSPPTVVSAAGSDPLKESGAVGAAVVSATQVLPVAPGSAGSKGTVVKNNDTELNAGALNDACASGAETVHLWFWVGRT
jgi:prepilin-type N-terminal cleavage/methylation domain-containing protein